MVLAQVVGPRRQTRHSGALPLFDPEPRSRLLPESRVGIL